MAETAPSPEPRPAVQLARRLEPAGGTVRDRAPANCCQLSVRPPPTGPAPIRYPALPQSELGIPVPPPNSQPSGRGDRPAPPSPPPPPPEILPTPPSSAVPVHPQTALPLPDPPALPPVGRPQVPPHPPPRSSHRRRFRSGPRPPLRLRQPLRRPARSRSRPAPPRAGAGWRTLGPAPVGLLSGPTGGLAPFLAPHSGPATPPS